MEYRVAVRGTTASVSPLKNKNDYNRRLQFTEVERINPFTYILRIQILKKGNNDIGADLSIHVEQKDRGHVPFCYINKIHAAEYMKRIGNYRQLNVVASYRTSKPVEP